MPLISFEDGVGIPPPPAEGKAAVPGKNLIPFEQGLEIPPPAPSLVPDKAFWLDVGNKLLDLGAKGASTLGFIPPEMGSVEAMKKVPSELLGMGMQASDLTTGVVKGILGTATYWAATNSALLAGENQKLAAQVGQMATDELLPATVFAPWGVVADALGPEAKHAYENNPIAWVMGKVDDISRSGTSKLSDKTGIPAEHFMQLLNQFISSYAGYKMTPGVKSALEARIDQFKNRGTAAPEASSATPKVPDVAPVEPKGGPLDVMDTKAKVTALFNKAKQGEGLNVPDSAAVSEMFARIRRGEEPPKEPMRGQPPVETPPPDPNRIGAQAGEVPKTRLSEPPIVGEEAPKSYSAPEIESALTKVQNGQGFDLTAEEKISLTKLTQDAKGRFVDQYGKPLAIAAVTAAALSQLDDLTDGEKVIGVLGATMVPREARSWGAVSEALYPYTFPSLDSIGKGAVDISKASIEQRLRDPKLPEAERAIVQRVIDATAKDGKIKAVDLADGLMEETSGLRLTPAVTYEHASIGIDNIRINRWGPPNYEISAPPANTTMYLLPEYSAVNSSRHFESQPDLFGWTRSFRENGQRHVVELQSEFAQDFDPKQVLKAEELPAALERFQEVVKEQDAVQAELNRYKNSARSSAANLSAVDDLIAKRSELERELGELRVKREASTIASQLSPVLKNWPRRLIREELLDETRKITIAEKTIPALEALVNDFKRLNEDGGYERQGWTLEDVKHRLASYKDKLKAAQAIASTKSVRFADVDTVAKVEGWPDKMEGVDEARAEAKENLQRAQETLADKEYIERAKASEETRFPDYPYAARQARSSLDTAKREYAITKDQLADLERQAADPKIKFQDPGHQSIYDRYAGEITRYLKSLGGKHVVDKEGHGWYEVSLKAIDTPRGPMIKMLGNSDPKLLGGLAAATGVGLAAAGGMLPGIEKAAPRITPFVGPKSTAPTTLAAAGLVSELATKMTPEIEAATIAKFRDNPAGSRAKDTAATELYNENHRQVARAISSYAKAGIDLEEIVQHTFIKAFRTLEKSPEEGGFRGDSKFSTYLHTIATNLAKNAYKRGNPLKLEELTDEHADLIGDPQARTPLQELQNQALAARMQRAIERLPDEFRDTFSMKHLEGMNNAEIAQRQGIPEGTVASRLSRALIRLQRDLREFSDGESGKADPRVVAGIAALGGSAVLGSYLNPDHPLVGAGYGIGVGALLMGAKPIEWTKALVKATAFQGPRVDISGLIGDVAYGVKVQKRVNLQNRDRWSKAVPDAARQEAIYQYLEGEIPTQLNPVEKAVAQEVRNNFNLLGEAAKKAGVVKTLLEDYATRIYDRPAQGMFNIKSVGGASTTSPFAKPRGYKTRAEAEAAGWKTKTTNILNVMDVYADSMTRAIQHKDLITTLEAAALPDGTKLITDSKHVPKGYVFSRIPQLAGKFVHPDIMPDLEFVFQSRNVGAMLGALDAINSTQKRMAVSASLFHAMALEHAMIGATSVLKSPVLAAKAFGQSFLPQVFGESLAIRMIREGGAGDLVDRGMRAGLEFSLDHLGKSASMEDVSGGMYKGLETTSAYLDSAVPQLGKQTVGRFIELNHLFDKAMWGRFHTTLKLETFADKSSALSRNNAREVAAGRGELKSQAEIDKMAASFVNDIYGGLNWYQLGNEFQSRWGRQLAMAAVSPRGRLAMRLVLFAPDWTISTTRAFTKAFGGQGLAAAAGGVIGSQLLTDSGESKAVGGAFGALAGFGAAAALGLKGPKGSGLRGALPEELGGRAQNLVDLHRQYLMRSAFLYTGIVDALNYQFSGHHIWDPEQKDPTRLDLGDGRTMQVSKHFMEPFHWLIDPKKQAMGKASFVVKETGSQLMDQEYLSPHGAPRIGGTPRGQDVSLPVRVGHALKQFTPISAQGFEAANPQSAAASLAGMPIYGKTYAERETLKQQRKQEAIQRRINKRERGDAK